MLFAHILPKHQKILIYKVKNKVKEKALWISIGLVEYTSSGDHNALSIISIIIGHHKMGKYYKYFIEISYGKLFCYEIKLN